MTYLGRRYPNEFALRNVEREAITDSSSPNNVPLRVIGLPDEEIKKLVGDQYIQGADGSVERVVAGVEVISARLAG